jgi:hypothetical protein
MSKKLTLRLDEDVIERAKAYAAERDTSVSQLVEDYFRVLRPADPNESDDWRAQLSKPTRQFLGALEDGSEARYKKHLEDKYLSDSS